MRRFIAGIMVAGILGPLAGIGGAQEKAVRPMGEPELPQFAIKVKTTEPLTVAYKKFTGPFRKIPEAIREVRRWIRRQELVSLGLIMGEYYTNPAEVDSSQLEWAIMIPLVEPAQGLKVEEEGGVVVRALAPVQVAYTYHRGPHHTVGAAYRRLFQWIQDQGYQVTGPPREIYWTPPVRPRRGVRMERVPLTEVQVPVKKSQ